MDQARLDYIETIEDEVRDICRRYPDNTSTYEGTYLTWLREYLHVKLSDEEFRRIVRAAKMGSIHRLRFKVRKDFPLITRAERKSDWKEASREGFL